MVQLGVRGGNIPAQILGICVAAVLALSSGCGQTASAEGQVEVFPVYGKVTFEGKPLARAVVTLTPVNMPQGAQPPAKAAQGTPGTGGATDDDGDFELSTYMAEDGAPAGEYYVTVSCEDRSGQHQGRDYPELLPERYQNPTTSGLKVTIIDGENEFLELKLVK
jgi:hypothetical protein